MFMYDSDNNNYYTSKLKPYIAPDLQNIHNCASSGLKRDKIMYEKVTHDIVHEKFVMLCYVNMYCDVFLQALGQYNYIITLPMHR